MKFLTPKNKPKEVKRIKPNSKNYVMNITGEISENTFVDWRFAEKDNDLVFNINSYGGDLTTAMNIYERMRKEKRKKICKSFGGVESAAINIFVAGDERIAGINDVFMIHNGKVNNKTIDELQFFMDYANRCSVIISKRLSDISIRPFEFWMDLFTNGKNNYFTGQEMYDLGVVTELI